MDMAFRDFMDRLCFFFLSLCLIVFCTWRNLWIKSWILKSNNCQELIKVFVLLWQYFYISKKSGQRRSHTEIISLRFVLKLDKEYLILIFDCRFIPSLSEFDYISFCASLRISPPAVQLKILYALALFGRLTCSPASASEKRHEKMIVSPGFSPPLSDGSVYGKRSGEAWPVTQGGS